MKAKHSPGPWHIKRWQPIGIESKDGYIIADFISARHREEAVPNARLIAAAPDLLEVLKEVMSWEENAQMTWAPAARAAINKAEGAES